MSMWYQFHKPQPINFTKRNPKNPKNIAKTQNLGLKMHECMKMKGFRMLTKWFELDVGQKSRGWGDLSVRKVFGSRKKENLLRNRWENEKRNCASTLNRKHSSMDRGFYQESVEL